ncbi:hypothetical protein K443DRAFT_7726 [Laccaria amethystina LaAM-08-1]|uniref:Uncharacterized protein n=1 Tax=Laccaria amethystina LaAM-08-1 TaxID=1095629 RepID=A0A0C9XFG7_9AGAR|nr:hypothetical protein K443DRAFT_7726 [Laccaria amethystina LaAM-08-1]
MSARQRATTHRRQCGTLTGVPPHTNADEGPPRTNVDDRPPGTTLTTTHQEQRRTSADPLVTTTTLK